MGQRFKGVYNIYEKSLVLFMPHGKQKDDDGVVSFENLDDPVLDEMVGAELAEELREEVNMIEEVYPPFNKEAYLKGELSPVFFGSAVNNFGVKEMLDCFVDIAPNPLPRMTEERPVLPTEKKFTPCLKNFVAHA